MEIYVIRHTKVARKDICYGQINVPLADSFLEEVAQFKNELPTDFEAIFCSPLLRCKNLAEELHFDNIIFENALMEINFGEWEGQTWNEIDQDKLNIWMQDFANEKPPQGENLLELFERVSLFLEKCRKMSHKKILLITHSGVIRCIWAYLLEIPLQNIFKIPVGHQEIFAFNLTSQKQTDSIKQTK